MSYLPFDVVRFTVNWFLPERLFSSCVQIGLALRKQETRHSNFSVWQPLKLHSLVCIALTCAFFVSSQGSADSCNSQPSSDLSLDEDRGALQRETERQALIQLEKVRNPPPPTCSHSFFCRQDLTVSVTTFLVCSWRARTSSDPSMTFLPARVHVHESELKWA